MKSSWRGMLAIVLSFALAQTATAQGEAALATDRARVGYMAGMDVAAMRFDLIGLDALHGPVLSAGHGEPYEVRARVAGHAPSVEAAARIGSEVETLYTNGPAGGGGVGSQLREVLGILSTFIPRERVTPIIHYLES